MDVSDANGTPAPYGRACEQCSTAKARCVISPAGEGCLRCRRLNRECVQPPSSKRKRKTAIATSASQSDSTEASISATYRLERKIDELAASIKNNASNASPAPEMRLIGNTDNGFIGHSMEEAEDSLNRFRNYHARYFPFVQIPPEMTAVELRIQRPYLWLAILTTGSYSVSRQQQLGDAFRREIAEAMVVRSDKSIDLLLGLLTFIGWFHNQFKHESGNPKTSLAMFTQLAISLVFDLHLSKPATVDPHTNIGGRYYNHPDHPRQLNLEEIRAVLGCFLITSIISNYLQKTDPLRWTPQLDSCLEQLSKNSINHGDEVLVHHVRMQLVVERQIIGSWFDATFEISNRLRAPLSLAFQASFAQLDQVRQDIPEHLCQDNIVLAQLYSTELSLAEMAMWQTRSEQGTSSFLRQKYLYACLTSAKAWLETLESFSAQDLLTWPFSFASQSTRCLGMILYLSTLDDLAWDKEFAKKEVNIIQIMDRMVDKLERESATIRLLPNEQSVFARHCNFWKSVRPSLLAKLERQGAPLANGDATGVLNNTDTNLYNDMLSWDFFDNQWLFSMDWNNIAQPRLA